jgi:hypothetical protein
MKNIIKKSIFVLGLIGVLGVGASSALAAGPLVTSFSVPSKTTDTATLSGTIDPNGTAPIAYVVDQDGNTITIPETASPVFLVTSFSHTVTGLTPGTHYTYVLYADDGDSMDSKTVSFTTDPLPSVSITSASATGISTTGATLRGTIDPNGTAANAYLVDPSGNTIIIPETVYPMFLVTSFSYSVTGLTPGTNYVYTLYADDGNHVDSRTISFNTSSGSSSGGGGGGGSSTTNSPTVVTKSASNVTLVSAVLNGTVDPNNHSTTAWFEYGTSSNLSDAVATSHISEGSSNSAVTFAQTISGLTANKTYYFRAVANNTDGTTKGNILSFKIGEEAPVVSTPIITVQATSKTTVSARLNAIFLNKDGVSAKGYFQYGQTSAMTSSTAKLDLGTKASVSFADSAINLSPNTIYYFRAVAVQNGTTYNGKILVFQTLKGSVVPVVNNTTPSAPVTPEPAVVEPVAPVVSENTQNSVIQITTDVKDVSAGDEINYLVSFKNDTKDNFENTTITVQLPNEVDFKDSNFGKQSDDNTVVFDAGVLIPSQVGSMTIKGKVNSNASADDIIVTTAILSYNNSNDAVRNDEIAYVANNIISGAGGLTANSTFVAGLLPSTLMGWMLLIIAVLLVALVIRKIYMNIAMKRAANANHIDNLPM